ncbi:MAG: lysophospholipase [Candidatus Omnitrophica bacterium]|nr:lysophospholipase [Candidatus Omnitrophota bacterium]
MYRKYHAHSSGAVLLLVHGLGAHSARWQFLVDFFLQNNFSSYAIELRGFGETVDRKGHVDSTNIYFSDISRLSVIARKENPGKKIFLIAESIGALISFSMLASGADFMSGLVCISPAFSSRLDIKPLDYIKIFFTLLYNPRKQFPVPFTAEMCTRDAGHQKVMKDDRREHRLVSAKLAFEITRLQKKALSSAAKITLPTLFLLAGDDKVVDPDVSRRVFYAIAAKDKKIVEYPEMCHALSIDLGKEKVFLEILKWIMSYL